MAPSPNSEDAFSEGVDTYAPPRFPPNSFHSLAYLAAVQIIRLNWAAFHSVSMSSRSGSLSATMPPPVK